MKTQISKLIGPLTLSAALAGFLSGCGSTAGYKQADKTGEGIAELRDEVVNLKKSVDNSIKAIDQVTIAATTDPRKAYEGFAKSVDEVESASEKAKKRAEKMRAEGQAYFKQWETQLASVKNEEVRNLAAQRKAKLQETFESIKTASTATKDAFPPYLSDLKDLRTFLGNDLTVAGVDSAKALLVKSKDHGVTLQKAMDELVAHLNTVSATITPAKAKAK